MTEYDLIERMKAYLVDEITSIRGVMARGMYHDYAAYREGVGRISSLELALQELKDLEEKFIEQ